MMNAEKRNIYKKARDNGYLIEYGKRHYMHVNERRNGTFWRAIVKDSSGIPEMGYDIISFCSYGRSYVYGSQNGTHDKCFSWEEVAEFVNSL